MLTVSTSIRPRLNARCLSVLPVLLTFTFTSEGTTSGCGALARRRETVGK